MATALAFFLFFSYPMDPMTLHFYLVVQPELISIKYWQQVHFTPLLKL